MKVIRISGSGIRKQQKPQEGNAQLAETHRSARNSKG